MDPKHKNYVYAGSVVAFLIACGLVFGLSAMVGNSPKQNKQIEEKAFKAKNPSMCFKIKGESYKFGPSDAQVSISESEAVELCRNNIERNIQPVMHGG